MKKREKGVTRSWKVWGVEGHRQRESFCDSYEYDFSDVGFARVLVVENYDKTHTHDYSIVRITRNTAEECQKELEHQLSDGIFENSRVGKVEEIMEDRDAILKENNIARECRRFLEQ